ncbi:CPBP family intramembrane glutamic endopeptidase [Methylobacterium sp. J-068]|uniref:CPBP family intramembrane glutamic endopeptidase n=1 Tax=Methylobacterium sp. J-068 TaxID=2836649 RepID=UPI001FBBE49C|nr:CPBP family intramembrane glutamic endopeptidase [Methylobacterium sp. J-068]MCJ2033453.1 CPBP family intramembrane metalloprotease [Methylobacterium sp. J-068]
MPRPSGLRAGLRVVGALAGLAFSAFLALALATLLALAIVRVGADWIDGVGIWAGDRVRLHPRQIAMRELAIDVIRQVLLALLVVGAVRWRDGPAWRETLALVPHASAAEGGAGLSLRRFGLILLLWPLVHITWVTGSADLLHVPIRRHTSLSPGLTAGAAAAWFAYVLVLAPVAEEMLLRGALFARARRFLPPAATIGATGFLFALAHLTPSGFGRPVALIPLALMLGWVRWRSGRLWPSILLHAWSNLAMIAYVLWPAGG